MMLVNLIGLASIGFGAWWGTGIDDVLALGLLLRNQRPADRVPLLIGNFVAVIVILAAASAVAVGAIQLASGLLETRIIGIPLQNLAGIIPIGIGLWTLYLYISGKSDDDDDDHDLNGGRRSTMIAFVLGFQVYAVNAIEDFVVHLAILGSVVKASADADVLPALIAYWLGNLIGALSSVIVAGWLAEHMRTRRTLTLIAALVIIAIGALVVFDHG